MAEQIKLSIGCGRVRKDGFTTIDRTQFVDDKGNAMVDIVMDLEKSRLPFDADTVSEIHADNVLEHIGFSTDNPDGLEALIFVLNECHRVLKPGATLHGDVPLFGSEVAVKDITHKRFFVPKSFDYITGTGLARPDRPSHPRYADYGVLPWEKKDFRVENGLIWFVLSPRKFFLCNSCDQELRVSESRAHICKAKRN